MKLLEPDEMDVHTFDQRVVTELVTIREQVAELAATVARQADEIEYLRITVHRLQENQPTVQ